MLHFKTIANLAQPHLKSTPVCRRMGIFNLKSTKKEEEEVFSIEADRVDEELMIEEKEAEIERKRNKSRLFPAHRSILFGNAPHQEEQTPYHHSLKYKRKLFGRFGHDSGINPGALWWTRSDLKEVEEFERIAYPQTIQEMVETALEKQRKEEEFIRNREKKITENLSKVESWKKEVKARAAKKLADVEAAKAKKDALIEEVRRHFGYKIDPKDDRFKEALQLKEKENKKKIKEDKLKAKQEKLYEKIKQSSAQES